MNTATIAPPILVLGHAAAPNRLASYLREILATEGIACWDFHDLTAGGVALDGRALVILENVPLDAAWCARLEAYVRAGGRLLASRPPPELAEVFGLKPTRSVVKTCRGMFVTFDAAQPLAAGLGAESLQFQGTGDLYEPVGAQVLAAFGGQLGVATHYPAITVHARGAGLAAAFAFDLAACTVLLHQGTPLNASDGPNPDPNADGAFKPDDLFHRQLDERLKTVPQADLYADMLVRLVQHLCPCPLPRLWHYPHAAPSVTLLDGDSDSMTAEDIETVFATVEKVGGRFTIYLMPEQFAALSPERMARHRACGHDAGPHPFAGRLPGRDAFAKRLDEEMALFTQRYGFAPSAQRGHSVVWLGWDEHARELLRHGLRLDTNFCCGVGLQHGYLNGSGLPVRFVDEHGAIIDVYEQATISMEDGWYTEKCLLPALSMAECIALSKRQIDASADVWHAVYHPCFHPVYARPGARDSTPWLAAVAAHGAARAIPFVNAREWVEFNDARRAVRIAELDWNAASGRLSFTVRAARDIAGLTLLLPATFDGRAGTPGTGDLIEREGRPQLALTLDLQAGEERDVRVDYTEAAPA